MFEYNSEMSQFTSICLNVTDSCNLACKYCLTGDTQILMGDFSTKPIKNMQIGDKILGSSETVERYCQYKLFPQTVVGISSRHVNLIHRITFEDGRVLNITPNHKVLNGRHKWTEAKNLRTGTGKVYSTDFNFSNDSYDINNISYVKGYVTAMMFCDGSVKQYDYEDSGHHVRVRLAVKDLEIIDRIKKYFDMLNLGYTIRDFKISEHENLTVPALFSSKQDTYDLLINLRNNIKSYYDNVDYMKGFLAAAYDAEGHIDISHQVIRISNSSEWILSAIEHGLDILNIPYIREKGRECPNVMVHNIRVLSDSRHENLRFVMLVNPAVNRKGLCNFYNKSLFKLNTIKTIEQISGDFEVFNIETTEHTYIANGMLVHNCFVKQHPNFMSLDVAKQAIDFLYNNIQARGEEDGDVTFFGGEPMLMYDSIIKPIIQYANEKYEDIIHFNMTTNGTLLTRERIDYLKAHNVYILLSIDGAKETQDANRPCHDGTSSFDKIDIPYLLEQYPNITFRATIDQQTCGHTFDNYCFAVEQGFKNIFMTPNCREPWTEENLAILEQEVAKIYAYNALMFINSNKPAINMGIFNDSFEWVLKHDMQIAQNSFDTIEVERSIYRCGLGTTGASISYDGSIYACQEQDSYDHSSKFYIGDIHNGIDKQKHTELLANYCRKCACGSEDASLCTSCPLRTICQDMGCPSVNLDLFNDFHINPTTQCRWNLMFYRCAKGLLRTLGNSSPAFNEFLEYDCNYQKYRKEEA